MYFQMFNEIAKRRRSDTHTTLSLEAPYVYIPGVIVFIP